MTENELSTFYLAYNYKLILLPMETLLQLILALRSSYRRSFVINSIYSVLHSKRLPTIVVVYYSYTQNIHIKERNIRTPWTMPNITKYIYCMNSIYSVKIIVFLPRVLFLLHFHSVQHLPRGYNATISRVDPIQLKNWNDIILFFTPHQAGPEDKQLRQ